MREEKMNLKLSNVASDVKKKFDRHLKITLKLNVNVALFWRWRNVNINITQIDVTLTLRQNWRNVTHWRSEHCSDS